MRTFIAASIAAACFVSSAHAAARIEPLRPQGAAVMCTADRAWCVETTAQSAAVRHRGAGAAGTLPLETNEDERVESAIWPSIVRVTLPSRGEIALAGVTRTQREAYSGGGGSVTTLTLFELRPGGSGQPRAVLQVPLESSFLIRACFSREDEQARRGACHDEYRYRASLTALAHGRGGVRLAYRTRADSFPGRRNRLDDSTAEAPLRKADLTWAPDRHCTFQRELMRDPGTGKFDWSTPPPDCPTYLELQ